MEETEDEQERNEGRSGYLVSDRDHGGMRGSCLGEEKISVAGSGSMISLFNELAKAILAETRRGV